MAIIEKQAISSADLGEVMQAVSRVYCPHEATLRGRSSGTPSSLEVIRGGAQPIVALRYAAPVTVETDFRGLLLMQTCIEGSAEMTQGGARVLCRRDQTVPLSPGVDAVLQFDAHFSQRSVRVDIARLEALCARRMGSALDRPVQFALQPFSKELELAWSQAVSLMVSYERSGLELPGAAMANLDEFLLTLLLEKHPHNYSETMQGQVRGLPPRLIREAEQLMRTGGPDLTASQIATRLRVSLRSLEAGFKETRRTTPTQMLREIRLQRTRAELLAPRAETTVTSAALAHGFFHLPRFSSYYKSRFGELPAQTLRRRSQREGFPANTSSR